MNGLDRAVLVLADDGEVNKSMGMPNSEQKLDTARSSTMIRSDIRSTISKSRLTKDAFPLARGAWQRAADPWRFATGCIPLWPVTPRRARIPQLENPRIIDLASQYL